MKDGGLVAEQLVQRVAKSLEGGLLPAEVFGDSDLHELELERIFGRCWLFVGHESEVPSPGDFCLRSVGGNPYIMVRGNDGVIRIFFNGCRHRGSTLCRADLGNATRFECPYHGWTYDNEGRLMAVPARNTAYKELDFAEWGLLSPRVGSYREMIFACMDMSTPDLDTYLGKFKWYLDLQFALTQGGMEVIGEPHRWMASTNWKSGAENFTGDSSHTAATHRSLLKLGLAGEAAAGRVGSSSGIHVNNLDGHAISIRMLAADGDDSYYSYPEDLRRAIRKGPLASEQLDLVRRGVVQDGTVFPNLSFIHIGGVLDRSREPAGYLSLRTWQPVGPGRTEIWSWVLVPREATPEYREMAYRSSMATFSPSGNFEQDDIDVWSGIAATASTSFVRKRSVEFNYQMGMSGMSDVVPLEDWPGPGTAWPSNAGESGLRAFHRQWLAKMGEA